MTITVFSWRSLRGWRGFRIDYLQAVPHEVPGGAEFRHFLVWSEEGQDNHPLPDDRPVDLRGARFSSQRCTYLHSIRFHSTDLRTVRRLFRLRSHLHKLLCRRSDVRIDERLLRVRQLLRRDAPFVRKDTDLHVAIRFRERELLSIFVDTLLQRPITRVIE